MNIMKNKNILKTITVLCLFLIISPVANAEISNTRVVNTASSVVLKENVKEQVASKRAEMKTDLTVLKKDNANREINRRIESMTKMIAKINIIKRLTAIQKSTLISQVKAEIARLTTLRTKVGNDTDLKTLTTDKKTIINSYKTYAFFMPEMTIIAHADAVLNLVDLMMTKNPTGEALTKINVAKTLSTGVITSIINLTPEGYPANKAQLQSAKTTLQTARLNLAGARPLMK